MSLGKRLRYLAGRTVGLTYASAGFVTTHVVFALLILFLMNWLPYPAIDGMPAVGTIPAIIIDLGLIALFGLQHTGMARAAVKRISASLLPPALERATYVHFANAALILLVLLWQPLPATVWAVTNPLAAAAIRAVFVLGWALSFAGSLLIDHLQLLGMRQAWSWFNGEVYATRPFQRHWLYEHLRHPILLGLILAFWATPHMTAGHLLFAAGLTAYMIIGSHFEEKDLVATFAGYADYRARVPSLVPRLRRAGRR